MPTILRLMRILLPAGLLLLMAACGQKGALYLPGDEPEPGSAATVPCRTATCKALQQKADEVKAARDALEAESADSMPASTTQPASTAPAPTLELQPQAPEQETTP